MSLYFFRVRLQLIILVVTAIALVPICYAPGQVCGETKDGSKVPCDYSDDFYKNADYNSKNIDWDEFDQSKVPEERIKELPPERVDPNKVTDKSKLTKDQLGYTPTGSEPNINKVENWQDLDPKARDGVLSDASGKNVKTTLTEPTGGKVVPGGFEVDKADQIKVGYESYSGISGFQYKDGKSRAKEAKSRSTPDSSAINNREIEAEGTRVSSEETDSFTFQGINIHGDDRSIKNGIFETAENGVKATLPGDQKVKGSDNSGNTFEFESSDGSIAISTGEPPLYKVESGIFASSLDTKKDIVQVKDFALISMGEKGVSCVTLTPSGTYRWQNPDRIKDFGVFIPTDGENYKLCLRKLPGEIFTSPDGVIDFPANKIQLLGIVSYLRYPFRKDKEIKSFVMKEAYKGISPMDKTSMTFDPDFIYADINIENPFPAGEGVFSIVRSGNYEIIEQGTSRLQKIHVGADAEECTSSKVLGQDSRFSKGHFL